MYASCFHQKVKTAHTHTKIPTAFICTSHVRFHNFMQMISMSTRQSLNMLWGGITWSDNKWRTHSFDLNHSFLDTELPTLKGTITVKTQRKTLPQPHAQTLS